MKVKQLLLSLFALLIAMTAQADVEINETNFPDANFRGWLLSQEYGQDNNLSQREISFIETIDVNGRNIKSLKGIEYFTALTNLHCYQNWIGGDAMDELVESLPAVSNGELYVFADDDERNVMTTDQVAAAKAKGWTTYYYKTEVSMWYEYEGSDGIRLIPALSKGDEYIYDLSGRKIVNGKSSNTKLSRGINIIRMSDGTTRKVLVK